MDAPEQHINVIGQMGQTQVSDCHSHNAINAHDELVRILNGRASGSPYNCAP
jgi:hypothetical protein